MKYAPRFDYDGWMVINPAVFDGELVNEPMRRGLSYDEVNALVRGLAAKGRLIGFDVVEVVPETDLEAVRQGLLGGKVGDGHDENPPSAWTTEPLRAAASRLQQKAMVAATSLGSRSRPSS